jgi:hypothetical protein
MKSCTVAFYTLEPQMLYLKPGMCLPLSTWANRCEMQGTLRTVVAFHRWVFVLPLLTGKLDG